MAKDKITPSRNAETMAVQYLQHEFRKILHGIKDPKLWKLINKELAAFPKNNGESSFWNLVAAIAEDWKLKAVHGALSDTEFRWAIKDTPIDEIVLTGMSPVIDKYVIGQCNREPSAFLRLWEGNPKARREIERTGFEKHQERDGDPIFLWEATDGLRVFDGMRRILLAIIDHKKTIRAWVGKRANKRGKPRISDGFAYVLSQVYAHSSEKGEDIDKAFITIARLIAKDFRNGRTLFEERIAGWSHDPRIKKLFKLR